ncbi:MAG: RagB/SusD family nutrient uptake outer membrane protein [Adhaeribacter sp.]
MTRTFKYLLFFALAASTGCETYLEKPVDQRTQIDTVEKVSELLVSAYPKADYATFTETMSDLAMDKGRSGGVILEEENQRPYFYQDVLKRTQGTPTNYWNACYAAIAAANHALQAISRAPDPEAYRAQQGEALVARAYAHFMLVTLFAQVYNPATAATDPGIPYVTEPEKVVFGQYDRKTVAYVYEQIEKDLTQGLPLINNQAYRIPKYHFNTAAAHAFAARFYLFKRDYQKVLEHANLVFPGGNIGPNLRPWKTVYTSLTVNEGLAIYTKATENANLLLAEAPSNWARNLGRYNYGLADPIVDYLFRNPNVTGARWLYPLYLQGEGNNLILKFREHFVRESANANFGVPYTIFPLFTAEEVLFNRAEANLELGNLEAARADLNLYASTRIEDYDPTTHALTDQKLRSFYQTNSVNQAMMIALLEFKAAEFVQEGMRWFDILRHRLTVYHPSVNGQEVVLQPDDPRRVLQIPQDAVLAGIPKNPR